MSDRVVPVAKPAKPTMKIAAFLTTLRLLPALYSSQNSKVSMKGGASRARVEELKAPTREMNISSRGISAANATARECMEARSNLEIFHK